MKTKKIILSGLSVVLMIFTLIGCRKNCPIPEPPAPPKPPIEISTSTISLMVGMSSEISVSNLKDFSVSTEKSEVVTTRIEGNTIRIEALAQGSVVLTIRDKADASRSARLTITVTPIKFGLMDVRGVMVLEAHYRFQGPENLHLAPSGTLRKQNYLKIPIEKSLQQGNIVSVEYKTPEAEIQNLQAKISLIKNQTIYATMPDGGYLIFEKK